MATCESEIKRLKAIQNQKREFERRQQIIRDSLKGVDTKPNNKIVFGDDDEPEVKKVKKTKSSNPVLFDSDDEDLKLTGHEFDNKPKLSGELIKLQGRYAHDKRFVLDERFADDENAEQNEYNENEEEIDEKAFNFKVLEDVLGKPVGYKQPFNNDKNKNSERKFKPMVRYDPEDQSHAQYEMKVEKPEPKKKKEKKTKEPTEVVAEEPPPVSNEIFYSVSENLTQSLKKEENEEEGFSLLKMFGRNVEETEKKIEDFQTEAIEPKSKQYNPFKERNPFKYDSSDDENEDQSHEYVPKKEDKSSVFENKDDFFFIVDDPRLLSLKKEEFLRPQNEEADLSSRRRELKRIVKKKIHNIQRDRNQWKHNKTWKGHEKRKKL